MIVQKINKFFIRVEGLFIAFFCIFMVSCQTQKQQQSQKHQQLIGKWYCSNDLNTNGFQIWTFEDNNFHLFRKGWDIFMYENWSSKYIIEGDTLNFIDENTKIKYDYKNSNNLIIYNDGSKVILKKMINEVNLLEGRYNLLPDLTRFVIGGIKYRSIVFTNNNKIKIDDLDGEYTLDNTRKYVNIIIEYPDLGVKDVSTKKHMKKMNFTLEIFPENILLYGTTLDYFPLVFIKDGYDIRNN